MAKTCFKCGEPLPSTKRKDAIYCSKKCQRSHYWILNKDRLREQNGEWRNNNRTTYRATARRYYEKNRESILARERMRAYGISQQEYDLLIEEQGGRCAICDRDTPGDKRKSAWHVDHDHQTGRVRGLLCSACNLGLGHFKDNPDRMYAAIEYVDYWREAIRG